MAKLTKSCVMRFTKDKVYLIVQESATNGGVSVWCQFSQVGHTAFLKKYVYLLLLHIELGLSRVKFVFL